MKIVKNGLLAGWMEWVNKELSCKDCKCQFVLEKGDQVQRIPESECPYNDERGDHNHSCWKVNCPCCKQVVYLWTSGIKENSWPSDV